jgi:hypothetical protein
MSTYAPPSADTAVPHGTFLGRAAVAGAAMLAANLLAVAPFHDRMGIVYRHFDGPYYMAVAKTFYGPADFRFLPEELSPPSYLATHLPLYPLFIRASTLVTLGRYPEAMLLATLLSAIAAAVLFLRLLEEWRLVRNPLLTAVLFSVFPPRWLVYHAVGASEPLFLALVFAAFLAFGRGRRAWVVAFVLLASLTRIVGLLLVPVFVLSFLAKGDRRGAAMVPLAGFGVLALFLFYGVRYGDCLAYVTWNQGHEHLLSAVPFWKFLGNAGVGDFQRAEHGLWTYALYFLGVLLLWPRRELFFYAFTFFTFTCFIAHLDVARYMIPIAPFAILVAWDPLLSRREARFWVPLVVVLDAIYVWGWLPASVLDLPHYRALQDVLSR